MSFDLVVQTAPGVIPEDNTLVAWEHELIQIADRAPGANITAARVDPEFTKWFLENDAFPLDPRLVAEFHEFCRVNHIAAEPLTPDVAVKFWTGRNGAPIATIGCPTADEAALSSLYQSLVTFCKAQGLHLYDPQAGKIVSLSESGLVPPGW